MNIDKNELYSREFIRNNFPDGLPDNLKPVPDELAEEAEMLLGDSHRVRVDRKANTPLNTWARDERKKARKKRKIARKSRKRNR